MNRNVLETVMGAIVLALAGVFVAFAYSTAQVRSGRGYEVTATFSKIDGIREGTDVRISGIRVGTVTGLTLDPVTFAAVTRMQIDEGVKLPKDTQAQITSSGLLGDKFMSLLPGGDEADIPPGGTIARTVAPMSIEDIIGQVIYSTGQGKSGGS